jgi:hypothetical protein
MASATVELAAADTETNLRNAGSFYCSNTRMFVLDSETEPTLYMWAVRH